MAGNRWREGFRRLAVALGALGLAAWTIFILALLLEGVPRNGWGVFGFVVFTLVGGAVAFGAPYGLVRLCAWVLDGFLASEDLRDSEMRSGDRTKPWLSAEQKGVLGKRALEVYTVVLIGVAVLAGLQRVTRLYELPVVLLRGWLVLFALPLAVVSCYSAWRGVEARDPKRIAAALFLGVMAIYVMNMAIVG